ncbi:hypothetical protein L9O85_12160 [Lawsonibacter asaccharolyticus]|uniref:hypothetical protein n=1 Tax=Lawsonibacter asaccharolyticus TaxID=2108523 RepID=UPI00265ADEB7|nr:hypothetical protein [Lawsonibacter asaccharolyticus]UMM46317.1 hypothetical protein L9O85_12160 [Lawsonibacter asaccharolyticus]
MQHKQPCPQARTGKISGISAILRVLYHGKTEKSMKKHGKDRAWLTPGLRRGIMERKWAEARGKGEQA